MRSAEALLTRIIDYAGLFPPAGLGMRDAVANFARYADGPHESMLGRFILPIARLEEFESATAALPYAARESAMEQPWRLSALVAPAGEQRFHDDIRALLAFNDGHDPESAALSGDDPGFPCLIDTIEVKAPTSAAIDAAIDALPEGLLAFFEIPIAEDPRGLIAALAGEEGVGAKVRTGGVTPDAFPKAEHLARFIHICAAAGAPFKATAGLHHPVRGEFNLTYEPNAQRGVMFGFLNVFLAAAFVYAERMPPDVAEAVLMETSRDAFRFEDGGVLWRATGSGRGGPGAREWGVSAESIARVREQFAISFGSCSFEEPVQDLQGMGLLR